MLLISYSYLARLIRIYFIYFTIIRIHLTAQDDNNGLQAAGSTIEERCSAAAAAAAAGRTDIPELMMVTLLLCNALLCVCGLIS